MFCKNCGNQVADGATTCPNCGVQLAAQPAQQIIVNATSSRASNGCATAGFVLALIGLFIPFFVFQVLGLILSIVGIVKASKAEGAGRGLAIAGLVISLLGVIVAILTIMALVGTLGAIASSVNAFAFMI